MKLKLESTFRASDADKQRLKRATETATSGLQAILEIAKQVAGVSGVPGLQAGIGGMVLFIDVVKVSAIGHLAGELFKADVDPVLDDPCECGECREARKEH